ncbi:MAG: histidine phosphatase family protein [Anaerolineaceae bacterium]|nr:histidine phosphatase family protein [Anaerolineaceae bacterium]
MKTLILMRHASAEARENDQHDVKRPLNTKGRKAARKTGRIMKNYAILPQRVLSSFARRANQTAKRVVKQLASAPEIVLDESLYLAEPQAFIEALHQMPDELQCVMIVGHNPGLKEFLQMLTGTVLRFPKVTAAYIHLPLDSWKQITMDTRGELDTIISW